jgi:hypothetical protein
MAACRAASIWASLAATIGASRAANSKAASKDKLSADTLNADNAHSIGNIAARAGNRLQGKAISMVKFLSITWRHPPEQKAGKAIPSSKQSFFPYGVFCSAQYGMIPRN